MNVLVTGGCGFVGLNVARALATRGLTVWIADRSPRDAWVDALLREGAEQVRHLQVDLARPGELADALHGLALDAVVHAAVITATTEEVERRDARDIVDTNIGGTLEALQAALATGARRFIYVSSPSALGVVRGLGTATGESVRPQPNTLYGITKLASEQIVERWADLHGLEAASVRIAQPYGPGERATGSRVRTSPIWEWLQNANRGEPLVTGPFERARDWTYVEDTADGIVRLVTADLLPHRLYHLGTGVQVSVGEVVTALTEHFGALSCDRDAGPPDLNPNISGPNRPPLDPSRYASDFGWRPTTPIAEGMARYLAWWDGFRERVDVQ